MTKIVSTLNNLGLYAWEKLILGKHLTNLLDVLGVHRHGSMHSRRRSKRHVPLGSGRDPPMTARRRSCCWRSSRRRRRRPGPPPGRTSWSGGGPTSCRPSIGHGAPPSPPQVTPSCRATAVGRREGMAAGRGGSAGRRGRGGAAARAERERERNEGQGEEGARVWWRLREGVIEKCLAGVILKKRHGFLFFFFFVFK